MIKIEFITVGPLTSIQDQGRFGALAYGVSASGPMDKSAYHRAGNLLQEANRFPAKSALEMTTGKLEFIVKGGAVFGAFCGGKFELSINGEKKSWENAYVLEEGCRVKITPGSTGNYAIVRLSHEFDVPKIIGSVSTNMVAKLGGIEGRMLKNGDNIVLIDAHKEVKNQPPKNKLRPLPNGDLLTPIRIIWGLHADLFSTEQRQNFLQSAFQVTPMMDRMGVRLKDTCNVFRDVQKLSLVSDTIVPGDIQILGDGTPTVLMRDHQPTGGYPRIATIISADIDRFAQMRPNSTVQFTSIGVDKAQELLKNMGAL